MGLVLVVPGRCERDLLHRVLAREMPGAVKQVINAKGDTNIVKDAVRIIRRLQPDGDVPLFLRDLDEYPCRTALRTAFDPGVPRRNIIVVYRCLEAWYLADEQGINAHFTRLPRPYRSPKDTDTLAQPQEEIKQLLQENGNPKGRQYEKTAFADAFAQHFSVRRGAGKSSSLARFVARLKQP